MTRHSNLLVQRGPEQEKKTILDIFLEILFLTGILKSYVVTWGWSEGSWRTSQPKVQKCICQKKLNRPLEFHWSPFASSQPFVLPWHRQSVCRCCRTCRSCAGERSSSFRSIRGYEASTRTSSNSQRSGSSARTQLCSLELKRSKEIYEQLCSKCLFWWRTYFAEIGQESNFLFCSSPRIILVVDRDSVDLLILCLCTVIIVPLIKGKE